MKALVTRKKTKSSVYFSAGSRQSNTFHQGSWITKRPHVHEENKKRTASTINSGLNFFSKYFNGATISTSRLSLGFFKEKSTILLYIKSVWLISSFRRDFWGCTLYDISKLKLFYFMSQRLFKFVYFVCLLV